jgi:hypothetical protein
MRRLALLALVVLGCVACASAKINGGGDDTPDGNNNNDPDGNNQVEIDAAPPIDAAIAVTMSQTGSTNVVATQIGCQQTNPLTNFTTENSYYRIFPLSDHNITSTFHVTEVAFAVERATAGNGVSQPAQIKIGTYNGTINAASFAVASLTQLASATVQIPQNAQNVVVPISMFSPSAVEVPPTANLYAEVFIPDGRPAGNIFYIGSNQGTETHPSYIRAQDCSAISPSTYASLGVTPAIRLLLTVSGVY